MIVFADIKEQTLTLAGSKVEKFHISDLPAISARLKGQKVIWVTNAARATGDEVIKLLEKYSSQSDKDAEKNKTGNLVMHAATKGQVVIEDQGISLIFKGPLDFKYVSALPGGSIDLYPKLRKAIEIGKIKVIDESEKSKIILKDKNSVKKKVGNKEKSLDALLIDSGVSAIEFASHGGYSDDTLDINDDAGEDLSDEADFIKRFDIQ